MSRCKACDCILGDVGKLSSLDLEEHNHIPEQEEDLCSSCLYVARDGYSGYNISTAERERYIRDFFYKKDEEGIDLPWNEEW